VEKTAAPSRLQVLKALEDAHAKLEALDKRAREPIALIGMSCRFPGADHPEAFWRALREGVDAIAEIPPERWDIDAHYNPDPDAAFGMYTRHMGLVSRVEDFDADFFGISPREARTMDPQQRLLLETCWETLERAGQAPDRLRLSATGVFVGMDSTDYAFLNAAQGTFASDPYALLGNLNSVAAGRIAYFLGLQGPTFQVDTACSSSLVALHLACQSLRSGEANLALAGGVFLALSPEHTFGMCRMRALSPGGKCKTFDAGADGYARGEGCGVVALKRLSDALADGDPILALIRGSAVNHDGPSSNLTVPNQSAQEALLRQALKNARVRPDEVQYIEAHGTGTALGDPIEVNALASVFGGRADPLWIGSVKTNIGHLEAAAGVAGLIKVVLAMQNGEIPPHLHFHTPSPFIDWDSIPLRVVTEARPWPDGPRIAGLSSFGFSGTNAHVVIEAWDGDVARMQRSEIRGTTGVTTDVARMERSEIRGTGDATWMQRSEIRENGPNAGEPQNAAERPCHLLALSAKTEAALTELCQRYENFLAESPAVDMADLCHTANAGRSHFAHRLSLIARDAEEMRARLAAAAKGGEAPGLSRGHAPENRERPKIAFLFTGQGSQYVDMGRELYETQPTFRRALARCEEILRPLLGESLLELLYPPRPRPNLLPEGEGIVGNLSRLDRTAITQPALFALEYALAELWQSWGVTPDVALGHSVGEYAAACVAGVFSLEDGLRLIAARGRLMDALPEDGAMAAVMAGEAEVLPLLAEYPGAIALAAVNAPQSVVVSGRRQAVESLTARLAAAGIDTRPLNVSHAFHSPLMRPMLAEFERVVRSVAYREPQIDLVSNLSGKLAAEEIADPGYWLRHALQPVRFADGVETLRGLGIRLLVEIGPKPILLGLARQCAGEAERSEAVRYLPSLRANTGDRQTLLASLGEVYAQGATVDWRGFDRDRRRRKLVLPTYPFQRQRYWLDAPAARVKPAAALRPLIHRMTRSPLVKEIFFETEASVQTLPFLADHRVFGEVVMPGAGYLAMILSAVELLTGRPGCRLEDTIFPQALALPEGETGALQLVLFPEEGERDAFSYQLISLDREAHAERTRVHALGRIAARAPAEAPGPTLSALQALCSESLAPERIYEAAQEQAIDFGPRFRWLEAVWRGTDAALARLRQPPALGGMAGYVLHPCLLDACFQLTAATAYGETQSGETFLPFAVESLELHAAASAQPWWASAQRTGPHRWNIRLLDAQGRALAVLTGFEERAAPMTAVAATDAWRDWLYEVVWQPHLRWAQTNAGLPGPERLRTDLAARADELIGAEAKLPEYLAALARLEAISLDYIRAALRQLGVEFAPGEVLDAQRWMERCGVVPAQRRLFGRLSAILAEADVSGEKPLAQPSPEGRGLLGSEKPLTQPSPEGRGLLQIPPERQDESAAAAYALLHRCASALPAVLTGAQDPLQLLFPDGDDSTVTQLYRDAPVAAATNKLTREAVLAAVAALPAERGLRILEIGAGTGGTTAYLLPALPAERTEYVFTDIGAAFLGRAREKFGQYDFVQYQTLDIERDPDSQNFAGRQFDIVVAANVLHATRHLGETLAQVRRLLAPGGWLVLLEDVERQRWVDLTFGMTDGWWRFADLDARPDHPLLDVTGWRKALSSAGFRETLALPENAASTLGAAVIVAQADEAPPALRRPWLIFADASGVGDALAARLRAWGDAPILVRPGQDYARIDAETYRIEPDAPEDYRRLLRSLPALSGVAHLWSADVGMGSADLDAEARSVCGDALHLTQALIEAGDQPAPLWLVTRDAQAVAAGDGLAGAAQAMLWGMGRVIANEHPELNCALVDLDAGPAATAADFLMDELLRRPAASRHREDQLALRGNARYAARLASYLPPGKAAPPAIRADRAYWIVGGLGGLGLLTARWLAERGAGCLLLTGRSEPSEDARRQLGEIERIGARALVVRADAAREDEMARALAAVPPDFPLAGVIHAAGALDDGILRHQTWPRFAKVLAPKVAGAWHLHRLTQPLPLDFFVLFSSGTSLLGTGGQANHAAANAFLDALAHHRRALGLPALSIDWGAWSEIGAAANPDLLDRMEQQGLGAIAPDQGLAALSALLGTDAAQLGVMPMRWRRFLGDAAGEPPPFYRHFRQAAPRGADRRSARERLREAQEPLAFLTAHVLEQVAQTLGWESVEGIGVERGFFELGMDSLMSIELRRRLQTTLECELPSTLAFTYPSVQALTEYLAREALNLEPEPPAAVLPVYEPPPAEEAATMSEAQLERWVEELSGEEVDTLLEQKLNRLEEWLGAD
jgi:acyl transferase domain-containing protein/protein-L-isoaspartate O-methyltransferase